MLSFPILGCGRVQRFEREWGVGFRNRVSGWTGGLEMSGGGHLEHHPRLRIQKELVMLDTYCSRQILGKDP